MRLETTPNRVCVNGFSTASKLRQLLAQALGNGVQEKHKLWLNGTKQRVGATEIESTAKISQGLG
jgi:hypothetical protein